VADAGCEHAVASLGERPGRLGRVDGAGIQQPARGGIDRVYPPAAVAREDERSVAREGDRPDGMAHLADVLDRARARVRDVDAPRVISNRDEQSIG